MRIGVLGPLEIRSADGEIVDFGRPKVRSLLALLAAETGKTVSADRLIDGLWGADPPPTAVKTLQGYIFQLRSLAPDLIATERGGYRLNIDRSQVDAFRFEELIRKARAASGPEAIGLFEEALGLWRDVPFVDVDHDETIRSLRARLEEARLEAVEGRIEALISAGRHRQVVAELADLVMAHPLRERLWEQYMTALYVSGRQADALRAYQDARRHLVRELGIEPGASLRLLEEQILSQDPNLLPATISPSREIHSVASSPPGTTKSRDERKMITALFADVAGSTELSGRLDPEEMKLVFGEALSRFGRVAEELGGTVTSLAGDGFLALFGAPVTHEDDAERAVRAALRILEAATSYATEVRGSFGVEGFAVRVGVDSGPAAVGPLEAGHKGDYSGYGIPINTASRLQSAAKPGSLLVSASTRRLSDHAFIWGEATHLDLKGLQGTVTAWEVVKATPPGEARRIRRLRAPLVGRAGDLAAARELLEAVRRGSGGVLLISGEPGIGKSRLISELKSEVDNWADVAPVWIEGHGLSYGEALPYWPFRELIRAWLEVSPSEPDLRVRVALHRKLEQMLGAEAEAHYPYLGYLLGIELEPEASDRLRLSPESLQYRTFEVVASVLRAMSHDGPLVVVIDDLHWIDPTSLLLIDHVLPLIDEEALALIIAQRIERDHASWTLREEILRRYPHRSKEVRLEGLGASDEQQLLDELVRGADLPPELETRLLAAAEGNPFYLEELVGGLIDGGSLVPSPDGWRLDHETAVDLPTTVEAVVLARIDRLDQDSHEVLSAASVLGRTFGLPLLHEVVGDQATVLDSLRTLQRLDFLHEARRWPHAEYRFKHALIQEAAYRTIPTDRRVSVHRTAAAWLSEHPGREEAAGLLARHWLAAGDEEQAIPLLLQAGDQARREHALDEAIELYRSLLALLEKRGERRTMALTLFKLGQALHSALRFAEASATFERAFTYWDVPTSVPKATATLRHAGSLPPKQPDPPRSYNLQDMQLQMALFDRLVERLAEDTVVPSLAERWEVSDDGLRYLFHLRPGLLWSDGLPLTASDVEYGVKRNLDPARPGISVAIYFVLEGAQGYALGQHKDADRIGVKALDDRTVEFRLAAPAPFFLSVVNRPDGGPQPQHAIERFGDSWIDVENQVVSGPFRRTEVNPTLTVLERRPDYQGWRSGNVKRVELHTELPSVVGDNYRIGERELVFGGAVFGTEQYGEIPTGEVRMEPTAWLMYLMLRHTDGPTSNLPYRRALAHTIDRRRLQAKSPANFLPATGGIVPPVLAGHTPDIALRHDPELARRLLAESGLGKEVLRLGLVTGIPVTELGFELVAIWREALGIPIDVLEYQAGDARSFGKTLSESHVMVAIWFPGYPDPEYYLRLLLHSESSDNRGHFNYPPYDDLIERARRERDGRVRLRLFHEADRMAVTEQVAIIPLVYARNVTISKPWVSGWWEFGKSWSSFADLTVDESGR